MIFCTDNNYSFFEDFNHHLDYNRTKIMTKEEIEKLKNSSYCIPDSTLYQGLIHSDKIQSSYSISLLKVTSDALKVL